MPVLFIFQILFLKILTPPPTRPPLDAIKSKISENYDISRNSLAQITKDQLKPPINKLSNISKTTQQNHHKNENFKQFQEINKLNNNLIEFRLFLLLRCQDKLLFIFYDILSVIKEYEH